MYALPIPAVASPKGIVKLKFSSPLDELEIERIANKILAKKKCDEGEDDACALDSQEAPARRQLRKKKKITSETDGLPDEEKKRRAEIAELLRR